MERQWFSFTPLDNGGAPGWLLLGTAGKAVRTGPPTAWHAASTGTHGFVETGAVWSEGPGTYIASFRLAATGGGAKLQVRDRNTRSVLAHLDVATGGRVKNVSVRFTIGGAAIDNIELKVHVESARSTVDVYDLNVQPA